MEQLKTALVRVRAELAKLDGAAEPPCQQLVVGQPLEDDPQGRIGRRREEAPRQHIDAEQTAAEEQAAEEEAKLAQIDWRRSGTTRCKRACQNHRVPSTRQHAQRTDGEAQVRARDPVDDVRADPEHCAACATEDSERTQA